MADARHLALAFLADHPLEAASVLEAMPQHDAVELFAQVPARTGAAVLAAMVGPAAARLLCALPDDVAMALIANVGTQAAVAALRHIPEPRRAALIEGLPTSVAVASRLLLGFPDDTAGAWTDPDVLALPADMRIRDALVRLCHPDQPRVDELHVINPSRHLVGVVDLHTLMRSPELSTLASILRKPVAVIAAAAPLSAAAAHRGWDHAVALPVVERAGRFIGSLRRAALLRALVRGRAAPRQNGDETVAGTLARGYWDAIASLAGAALAALPPTKRVQPEEP